MQLKIFPAMNQDNTTENQNKTDGDILLTNQSSSKKVYSCEICDKKLGSRFGYTNHLKTHSGKKDFHCTMCTKSFLLQKYLKQHMKKHRNDNPYVCYVCGRQMATKQALARHVFRKHEQTGERPFQCDKCDKTFVEQHDLINHGTVHSDLKPFCCEHCGQRFRTKGNMDIHKRIHTGEKPHECDICHKRFLDKGACISHRRIHTGEKPYKCTYCDRAFRVSHCLISHIRKHTGERPYNCTECEKTFKYRKDLVNHLNFHKGIKPYVCKVCNKSFYQQPNLMSHERRHSDKRPHLCNVCKKGFPTPSALEQHKLCHVKNKQKNEGASTSVTESVVNIVIMPDLMVNNSANKNHSSGGGGSNILYKTLQAAQIIDTNQDDSVIQNSLPSAGTVVQDVQPVLSFISNADVTQPSTMSSGSVDNLSANFIDGKGRRLVIASGSHQKNNNNCTQRMLSANCDGSQPITYLLPGETVRPMLSKVESVKNFTNISAENQFIVLNASTSVTNVADSLQLQNSIHKPFPVQILNNQPTGEEVKNDGQVVQVSNKNIGSTVACDLCSDVFSNTIIFKEHLISYHRVTEANIQLKKYCQPNLIHTMDVELESTSRNNQGRQIIVEQSVDYSATQTYQDLQEASYEQIPQQIFIDQPIIDQSQQKYVTFPLAQMEEYIKNYNSNLASNSIANVNH